MTKFTKEAVIDEQIPRASHYTPAFRIGGGDLIVTAGVVSIDAAGKTVGANDPAAQARQTLLNLKQVLEAAGASMKDVIQVRVYSTDMRNREVINAERRRAFGDCTPASTHVEVSRLARDDLLLEMEALAFVPSR